MGYVSFLNKTRNQIKSIITIKYLGFYGDLFLDSYTQCQSEAVSSAPVIGQFPQATIKWDKSGIFKGSGNYW